MNPESRMNPVQHSIDRRGFLKCMAWAGTGAIWSMRGGLLTSRAFGDDVTATARADDFSFVQISDSHIGFNKAPNADVTATLRAAIAQVNQLDPRPAFCLHTGDLTHLAKPTEFDTVEQVLKDARVERTFYVPGEHDVFTDDGKHYLDRFGKGTKGTGYQSFDYRGVHFVGLVNVAGLKPGGLGQLGHEQVAWLAKDVEGLKDGTPIVVFAHVPLWTVYPEWGWGTEDSAQALSLLKRFAAVTVLNGHIHQILRKVEGNVVFHTARSTAFPQPEPGKAPSPGPIKDVAAGQLRSVLGITRVTYAEREGSLAVVDSTLA